MSQATATARPLQSPPRAPRRSPAPTPLRVIPARITTTGNGAFASICVVLMIVGLIALLLLNTALAKGSIELGKLQRESAVLADTAGNFQEEIDRASASGELARTASQLGMVRSNERGYVDLKSGKVTGTAYPASRSQAFQVITSPTPVPKPKPSAKPSPAPSQTTATGTPVPSSTAPATPTTTATAPSATATGTLAPTTPVPSASATASPRPTQSPQATQSPRSTTAR